MERDAYSKFWLEGEELIREGVNREGVKTSFCGLLTGILGNANTCSEISPRLNLTTGFIVIKIKKLCIVKG